MDREIGRLPAAAYPALERFIEGRSPNFLGSASAAATTGLGLRVLVSVHADCGSSGLASRPVCWREILHVAAMPLLSSCDGRLIRRRLPTKMIILVALVSACVTGGLLALGALTLGVQHQGILAAIGVIGGGLQMLILIVWYLRSTREAE